MHKRITFRNMDHSDMMESYVNKQLEKIETFLEKDEQRPPIYIDIVLEASKVHEHPRAELRVKTSHYDLISNYEHPGVDLYDAIDRVIDVMYKQLHESKKKNVEKRKTCGRREDFKKQR